MYPFGGYLSKTISSGSYQGKGMVNKRLAYYLLIELLIIRFLKA